MPLFGQKNHHSKIFIRVLKEAPWRDKLSGGYKNVFKISRVPKMGHFYKNLSKHPELSIFRLNECQGWNFQLIFHHKLKKNFLIFFYPLPQKKFSKFFFSKISLWVLKRILLTRLKRFLIFKIHQRSFCTRIGDIINKRFK